MIPFPFARMSLRNLPRPLTQISVFSFIFFSITPVEAAPSLKIKSETSGEWIQLKTGVREKITGDSEFEIPAQGAALITLDGKIPIILAPTGNDTEIKLDPPSLSETVAALEQEEVSRMFSDIFIQVVEVQGLIQKKRVGEAHALLERIQQRYPKVKFFEFLRASILAMQGDRAGARDAVTNGLKTHPDYVDGKNFLKALGGGGQ